MSHDQPQAWRTVTIEDLGQVVTGRTPPSSKPEMFGSEYPFITPSDMSFGLRRVTTERSISLAGSLALGRIKLPPKSVAFVCIGATIGKVCLTFEDSFTNQQINSIVVDCDRHSPEFVYYLMLGMVDKVKALAGGAATPIVNKSSFCGILVSIPPIEIQSKIAFILSAYDDLIENNTRRIEILEEIARRLYEEWFVQFRFPGYEEKQLAFEQLNIFDIFSVKYGKGLSKKELIDGGEFPVYGAAKVIGHYHSYTYADRQIIAGCRGSVGEFRITEPKSFVTNNSFVFLPRASVDFFWGYQALKMRGLKDVIGGAAQPQITLDALQSISIPYPSSELREAYSDSVSPLFSMVWNLERKNKNLRTQRDLLLPKLISGEIDVSDIPMPT